MFTHVMSVNILMFLLSPTISTLNQLKVTANRPDEGIYVEVHHVVIHSVARHPHPATSSTILLLQHAPVEMDSPTDIPAASTHNDIQPIPRPLATRSSSSSTDGHIRRPAGQVDTLRRRGHSDGDVLSNGSRLHHYTSSRDVASGGETWVDFLRNSDAGSLSEEQAQIATRKAVAMAADRKRRYTGQQEEYSRRRSASNVIRAQPSSDGMRQSLSLPTATDPPVIPRSFDNRSEQRIIDRPLPPRPGAAISYHTRARDVALPVWQPDAEVSVCPICGQHFNFWYRKHHCRKCGRVVCSSCSPHRITIPRQFIVHPPSGCDPSLGVRTTSISTTVDLTGDDEVEAAGLESGLNANRPQNQDNRIDPALGGGQEVRLCNPCVPDPNPSPHLPFTAPNRYDPFSNPQYSAQEARLRQEQSPTNPNNQQRLNLPHGHGSGQPRRYPRSAVAGDIVQERQPNSSSFMGSSTPAHRQSRPSRAPEASPRFSPNHSWIYGSAPDPSFQEVSEKNQRVSV